MTTSVKTVAIIGAGPVGLAAAAHALERGLHPIVLEAGEAVGHTVRQWSHVRMFSPWSYNVDKAAERLLRETGWNAPDPGHIPPAQSWSSTTWSRSPRAHPSKSTSEPPPG